MISVIISTFRRPARLKKAIESVFGQTFTDWELIVVDDKSKDDTKKTVLSFKDPRIVYIERKKNFGCDTQPKNDGILASKGEYIAFLDDDNQYRPEHLSLLYKAITADPAPDVVYGDRWLVDETKRIPNQIGISSDFRPELLMKRNFIDTSDVLVKKQALLDIGGFDERYKKYIDWNLWIRLCKAGKTFKHVNMIITDYHLHEDMKSVKVKTKHDSETVFAPEWDGYDIEVELPFCGHTPTEPKIAIFTLTKDRLEYTRKSFHSLKKTAGYPYEHFVVDNGSTDGTVEYLKKMLPPSHLILNPENVGISKASNQAVELIKQGQFDIVVKWDNDCIGLTPGWLAAMVKIWKSNHRMALSCYVQGLVDNPGGAPRVGYGQLCGELIGVTKHIGGICHFADIDAYKKFKWDEDSFLHGVQDMEMSQYLQYTGWAMGYLENYLVSHGIGGTEQQKKDFPEYFTKRVEEKRTRYETNK